jgi:hypothetical protein
MPGNAFSSGCDAIGAYGSGASCTAESLDGGMVAIASFLPNDFIDPWLGVTVGYELQGVDIAGATGLFSGISPSALAGFDFRVRNREHKGILGVGPYVGVTLQRYLTADIGGKPVDTSSEPFHTWIHFGLRFTLPS